MPYLLDTDWTIDYLADEPTAVQLVESLAKQGISLSIISYMEVSDGIIRAADPITGQQRLRRFLELVPLLVVDADVAGRCALIRDQLRAAKKRVNSRSLDLLIAATAISHGLTMVTRNVNDYVDVPGLTLYEP